MAEAHSAVAFSFTVSHEGLSFDYDSELAKNIWHTFVRAYKKRAGEFSNNFKTGIYPAHPYTLLMTILFVCGLSLFPIKPLLGIIPFVQDLWIIRAIFGEGFIALLVTGVICSCLIWFTIIQLIRWTIKGLLQYRGWMFAGRKVGLLDKTYFMVMRIMAKTYVEPMLHSFQGALPRLPLPSLDDTLQKHLQSVKPILDAKEYEEMKQLTEEFRKVQGRKFQAWLLVKSWFTTNYVNDWWENFVYLRGRGPLMVNSNYYAMDTIFVQQTTVQSARAANFIYASLQFRRSIERQELKPIMIQYCIPLCSSQYERLFNTCRIPGVTEDKLKHWADSSHVAVYHRGCWYKMPVHNGKQLYSPAQLQVMIEYILEQDATPAFGEAHLGALTAGDRATWALARKNHFAKGENKKSLDAIEKSAFTLILDESEMKYDPKDGCALDNYANTMLHGNCCDRWYDKTFNLVVSKNAKIGLNCEHSWADAPVIAHLIEVVSVMEVKELEYTESGNTRGEVQVKPPNPTRLTWNISAECNEVIEESLKQARLLAEDVDMALLVFDIYGKGLIKKFKVSPDAFLQAALQLTYFQDQGCFTLTYEASMTRLYREGRTETVRSLTQESCDFVRAMCDPNATDADRVDLLRKSCDNHVYQYRSAMCGKGVDRHLFALYVVSRYLEVDSPFLNRVITEKWRLSTSQTPMTQTEGLDLNKHPEYISGGGGFGPVADDGYGVSYILGADKLISFHISSKKGAGNTNSQRFRSKLVESLVKMRDIFHLDK